MKSLLFIAAGLALATAKPETYRENEDFQYSRSSSDDGTKSGYYGAQRGNMGGNYEKAHNMDSLAQNQMSGLVRQVEGDLGDGSNTRTGSVYSAANSRGMYGSGRYDLRNLEGRNFQESTSSGNSHSSLSSNSGYSGQSSASSQSQSQSSGYSQSQNSRYRSSNSDLLQSSNLQSVDAGAGTHSYDYGRTAGSSTGYHSQSGHQSSYTNQQSSNGYGSNAQTRLIAGAPARVIIRPGGTVIIPVAAQSYDSNHRGASSFDQNAINSEAEVLGNTGQQTHYRPSSDNKNYESSYSYRKQWEKHDTVPSAVPLAIPTVMPHPSNSELYDDTQTSRQSSGQHEASGYNSQYGHRSNAYNSNVKSALSSQSQYRTGYNSQHSMANSNSQSGSNSNAYTHGAVADASNLVGDDTSRPKSYQSSYSYHKSWERQGDPYVIIPGSNSASDGQTSQRLTSGSGQHQYGNHQYGSHYGQSHQHSHSSSIDCDENGHIRVARSYNVAQNSLNPYQQGQISESQGQENLNQQTQNGWENLELGQETQDLKDLGQQQTQSGWENFEQGQQTQDLKDLGQQTQTNWNSFNQNGNDKLEDLGQQTQNNWNPNSFQNMEDLRQQTQNQYGNSEQQTQNEWNRLKDEGQQTQNQWNKLENFGQETQTDLEEQTRDAAKPDKLEDLGHRSQSQWDKLEDLGQQVQGPWNTLQDQKQDSTQISQQEAQSEFGSSNSFYQYFHTSNDAQNLNDDKHVESHRHNIWDRLDGFDTQNTDQKFDQQSVDQLVQSENGKENIDNFQQQNNWHEISHDQNENLDQQTQGLWGEDTLNKDRRNNVSDHDQVMPIWQQFEDNTQQVSENAASGVNDNNHRETWNIINGMNQQKSNISEVEYQTNNENNFWNTNDKFDSTRNSRTNTGSSSSLQGLWDKINDLEQTYSASNNQNKTLTSNNSDESSHFSQGEANFQNNNQNTWSHTNHSENSYGSEQSHYHSNQYGSNYGEDQPNNFNELTSTSTTIKPREDLEITHNIENLRPLDIGRGDIGPEDSQVPKITTTEKPFEKVSISPVFKINSNNKTTEEIETLSLTKEPNKTTNVDNTNQQKEINQDQNIQQSDNGLNVLNLNQQKWLIEQQNGANQYNDKNSSVSITSSTTPKINSYYNTNTINEQNRSQNGYSQWGSSTMYYNNNRTVQQKLDKSNSDSGQNLNGKPGDVNFGENSDEIEQQNTEQQFENFGQFGQQSENFDQQNQNGWGQDLEDHGQQTQNVWQPQDSMQQEADTQHFENFGRSNAGQYQSQNFYNHRYMNNDKEQSIKEVDNLQISPEISQNVEIIQTLPSKHEEVISPPEPTTAKPGFWKSVGNKFTNAKDSVASWFRS